jgi:alpha-N-arabinofuranosidase
MTETKEASMPHSNETQVFHVSPSGSDANLGTVNAPFKTITAASNRAMPGDTVMVHAGSYRERVDPPRGGESSTQPITYQAAEGELVTLLGSESISNWQQVDDGIWKASVPNQLFGNYNPYSELIRGDWFNNLERKHHTGCVYIDGEWLIEAETRDALKPMHWFATVEVNETILWAHFGSRNPNLITTEINVRPCIFYPSQPGINYITVRGFVMRHAATNWAPPTTEQVGLIGTNWSQGWVIEKNTLSHSRCVGITLGKYRDAEDHTAAGSANGYLETINRAYQNNWHRDFIGAHRVRNNHISHCEQAGIAGSLGAIFSEITGNTIHEIYQQRTFAGEELAAIKIHGAIDTLIARNHIYRSYRAIWLDWMAQGARVSQNLCHDNDLEDLFLEVNHGPTLIDGNVFLSAISVNNISQGSALVTNVFGGKIRSTAEPNRKTPCLKMHSTEFDTAHTIAGGDDRFINNLVIDHTDIDRACASQRDALTGDWTLDPATGFFWVKKLESHAWPSLQQGNTELTSAPELSETENGYQLHLTIGPMTPDAVKRVHSDLLGSSLMTGLPFLNCDGTDLEWSISEGPQAGTRFIHFNESSQLEIVTKEFTED